MNDFMMEALILKKSQEAELEVVELKISRRALGVTRCNRI